jgi:predicted nucleic acid binding AN1-type Zn finger protein
LLCAVLGALRGSTGICSPTPVFGYTGKTRSRHARRSIQHIPAIFRDNEIFKKIRTNSSDFFAHPVTDFRAKKSEVGGISNPVKIFLEIKIQKNYFEK